MAEEKEVLEEESEGKKKGKGKLIIIAVVALLLLGGGGAAFFLMGSSEEELPATNIEDDVEAPKHFATLELETIIVNLSKHSKFLKTVILLEYDPTLLESKGTGGGHGGGDFSRVSLLNHGIGGGAAGGGGGESSTGPGILGERMPMIKDAIIAVLSSKTAEEVLTADGKEELKDELIEAVNEAIGLAEEPVVAVYFLEFIIQ